MYQQLIHILLLIFLTTGLFRHPHSLQAMPTELNDWPERLNQALASDPHEISKFKDLSSEQQSVRLQQLGILEQKVMMPMRDGTRLSTSYFTSALLGKWPAVLIRTPYGKEDLKYLALLLFPQGYVLVTQDTRGRYGSEGEDLVFHPDGWGELQDGYDTIEWIAQQDWNNGKVGTWGYSALGITGSMAAGAVPPHLVCQVFGYSPSRGWGQTAYQGGAFRKELVEEWLISKGSAPMLPIFRSHPTNDAFWNQYDIESRYPFINVPALFIGGWYDCFQEGTLHDFVGRQTLGAPGARNNNKMRIGPWTHVHHTSATQGELTFPTNSVYLNEIQDSLDWYDYWMKDEKDNGVAELPTVSYYVMGDTSDSNAPGNTWKSLDSWPPPHQMVPFYLQPDHTLSLSAPTVDNQIAEIVFDPSDPVPTQGGFNLEIPAGPFDQQSIEARVDTLAYTSPPLEQPLEITGNVRAVVLAESNLTDTDITVRLTDVYPDGRSILLCDGILRASFRESDTNPTTIVPGQVYCYEIDLWSTSIVLNRGHRFRVTLANSNYPRFDLNPVFIQAKANNMNSMTRIHTSSQNPSHILLPVVSGLPDGVGISNWFLHR